MRFFKKSHVHDFTLNTKETYMRAFQQIVVEHQVKCEITRKCKCGATQKREVQLGFQMA